MRSTTRDPWCVRSRTEYPRGVSPRIPPMGTSNAHAATAAELRRHLVVLNAERAAADLAGLGENRTYMADLEDEIAAERAAYVGTAVTEIATLRAALSGPLHG